MILWHLSPVFVYQGVNEVGSSGLQMKLYLLYLPDHSVKFPLLPTMIIHTPWVFVLCNHHMTCVIYVVVKFN